MVTLKNSFAHHCTGNLLHVLQLKIRENDINTTNYPNVIFSFD